MVILVVFAAYGCKKDKPADQKPAPTSQAPPETPPMERVKPDPATPDPAAPDPAAPKQQAPKTADEPKPDPSGDKALPAHSKPRMRICTRACNKAQACGTASGSVSACVGNCLGVLEAPKEETDKVVTAVGFYAQEGCADVPCRDFKDCVSRKLVGETTLAEAPPMSKNAAVSRCAKLCGKEQLCDKDTFEQRPGGMRTCKSTCEAVLVSPQDVMAVRRVVMNKTFACIDKGCAEFDLCVRAALAPTP